MSRETALARGQARQAVDAWRLHCQGCTRCTWSARRRTGPGPCKQGASLWLAHESAQKELAESKRLDSLPCPGQEALF